MKKFILGLALMLLMALQAPADAANWNVKQKDTGAAVWEESTKSTQVPVGDSGLTVLLENVSSASTAYVVSHKTGNIVKIWSVAHGATTVDNASLSFYVVESNGVHTQVSGSGGTITIAGTGSAGDIDSITFTPGTTPNIAITQGQAIAVVTDGGSTTDVDATITIVIE